MNAESGQVEWNKDEDFHPQDLDLAPSAARRSPGVEPIAPEDYPEQVDVLIVGGGPAGLTAAILLAQKGVDVFLVERRGFRGHFPRAHLLNVRTMEVFAEMGVSDDVYAISPPESDWHAVAWVTSLTGPGPLQGLRLGSVPAWGGGDDAQRYAQASPRRFANVPQVRLDRLLYEHARAVAPGRIRAHQEVLGLDLGSDGSASVRVHDRDQDRERTIRARYVIGADGGRVVSRALGVTVDGPTQLLDQVGFYVRSDLSAWADDGVLIYKLLSPHGQGNLSGSLLGLGPDRWGRRCAEWQISRAAAAWNQTDEEVLADVKQRWGIPSEHPMEVLAVSHWQYEGVVASTFRVGPVFLVGDAAHRHPPTGGLGLNAAVQDAHNLAWKLALVLAGDAQDGLLDTYDSERRPVAAHYVAHALENATRHLPVAEALGQRRGQTMAEGWAGIRRWTEPGPDGDLVRAEVAKAIAHNAEDFSQLNVEAGFSYVSSAIVPDGTPAPPTQDSATEFTPTGRPGHHLPHVWVRRDGELVSTVDLVDSDGFTLFVTPAGATTWTQAAARTAGPRIQVVTIGTDAAIEDVSGEWAAQVEIGDDGALLVRPDRFVAWRATSVDQVDELGGAVSRILAGGTATDTAVDHFLARIWAAGESLRRTRVSRPVGADDALSPAPAPTGQASR